MEPRLQDRVRISRTLQKQLRIPAKRPVYDSRNGQRRTAKTQWGVTVLTKIYCPYGFITGKAVWESVLFQQLSFGLRDALLEGVRGRKAEDPFGD